ncbi:MAG: SPOR domain-containing protein [Acidobacteriota bacterium]|nr:SPOR domain-containing protein [Acidobacteriota bacterium]
MKDNDPQTVGELLNRMGDGGLARTPESAPAPRDKGGRRPLARLLFILVFIALGAAAYYLMRGAFTKTEKQTAAVRNSSPENQVVKPDAAPRDTPTAAVNSSPYASPQPAPSASAKEAETHRQTKSTRERSEIEPKSKQQNSLTEGEAKVTPRRTAAVAEGGLTVQVGSYASSADAARHVERLKAAGIDASVVKASVPNRGVVYRVQAGHFNDPAEAARYGARLRASGLARDFFITQGGPQQ